MKAKTTGFIACMLLLGITISGCKSRVTPKETMPIKKADTAVTKEPDKKDTEADIGKGGSVPLTVIIKDLSSATAPVIVGVYGAKNKFPDPKGQLKEYKFVPKGKILTAKITDLKFGTYALAVYQDVNSSGKINKNFIGLPTEPYGFSNNYKPKTKAPGFDDCKFDYSAKTNSVTITMIR